MGEGADITEKFDMRVVLIGAAVYLVAALSVLERFFFGSEGKPAARSGEVGQPGRLLQLSRRGRNSDPQGDSSPIPTGILKLGRDGAADQDDCNQDKQQCRPQSERDGQ
jgi:hypothetical protein